MGSVTEDSERTALYRLYSEDGVLLYVGITSNLERRFAQHAADKDWWPKVARREVEWYGSRRSAECAEEAAIKARIPRHNRLHSPEPPTIKITVELTAVQIRGLDILRRALSAHCQPLLLPVDGTWRRSCRTC